MTTQLPSEERVRRYFVLFTGDEVPEIDRLAIIMQLLREMGEDNERRAALSYAADFYGFRVYPK